jgi:predicted RNA-binding Zn-ribbon protein involved in translation (DUF1610 family)
MTAERRQHSSRAGVYRSEKSKSAPTTRDNDTTTSTFANPDAATSESNPVVDTCPTCGERLVRRLANRTQSQPCFPIQMVYGDPFCPNYHPLQASEHHQ